MMCLKTIYKTILSSLLFFVLPLALVQIAQAQLILRIEQGVSKPTPIIILNFHIPKNQKNQKNQITKYSHQISNTIRRDFNSTGQFKIPLLNQLPQSSLSNKTKLTELKSKPWRSLAQNYNEILLGSIKKNTNKQNKNVYTVHYELINLSDLSNSSHLNIQKDELFKDITPSQFSALGHYIADQVYQYLTGIKGYFQSKIAYVNVQRFPNKLPIYKLIVCDADGQNPHPVVEQVGVPIATPSFSPNGKILVYVSYEHHKMKVFGLNLYTGKRSVISQFSGINSAPAFSPNGDYLALALSHSDNGNPQTNIYFLNLKNNKIKRITSLGTNTSGHFSPDGNHLVFTSNRLGNPQIFEMNLDSGQIKRLTFQGVQNFEAEYLPTGKAIVYMHQNKIGGPIQIAKLNLITKDQTILSRGELDKSPSVSPNGMMVVYASYQNGKGILKEVSIDGAVHINLPATKGNVQSPVWS